MTWTRTSIASFRGVQFFVESADRGGGRRLVTHEFPRRDDPFLEDMGRKARTFPVEGYVVGEDYQVSRDALIAALEEDGPGELVHPHYGTIRVACADFRVRESVDEGGMARFGIDFTEAKAAPRGPSAAPDLAARVKASAAAARKKVGEAFLKTYKPTSLVDSAAGMLRAATLKINNVRSAISRTVQEVATMKRRVDEAIASAEALARTPANLLGQLEGMIGGLRGAEALAAYAFQTGLRPPATTASRRAERANFDALQAVIQRLAVIRAAEESPAGPYDSHDEALAVREAIAARLDEQLELADPETFTALQQLRADLVRAVPAPADSLPHLVAHVPPRTVPSLVLAHRLYGDVALEGDIVARNRLPHPGFIPGGHALEVRTRG